MIKCAVMLVMTSVVLGQAAISGTTDDLGAKLRAAQLERLSNLQRGVEIATAQYRAGALPLKTVTELQLGLLDAQLDLADTVHQHIKFLASQLNVAENLHAMAKARFEAGQAERIGRCAGQSDCVAHESGTAEAAPY